MNSEYNFSIEKTLRKAESRNKYIDRKKWWCYNQFNN